MDKKTGFKTAITPTFHESVSCMIVSFGLLFISNIQPLYDQLIRTSELSSPISMLSFSERLNNILSTPAASRIMVFLLWMVIGFLAYCGVIIVFSIFRGVKNEIEFNVYSHKPSGTSTTVHFLTSALRFGVRLLSVSLLLCLLFGFFRIIFPLADALFLKVFVEFSLQNLIYGIFGVIVVAVSLFVMIVLIRIALLRTRVFPAS